MEMIKTLPSHLHYDHDKDRRGATLQPPLPDKLFMTLCRLHPSTKLKPMPAKNPHTGKWKRRYEEYKHSRTFGEYIRNGASPSDIPYDVLRGIVRFEGPFRSKCLMPGNETCEVEKVISRYWYRGDAAILKKLYLLRRRAVSGSSAKSPLHRPATLLKLMRAENILDKTDVVSLGKSYMEDGYKGFSERNLARYSVNAQARHILDKQTPIKDATVLKLLRQWHFDRNKARKNVMREGVTWVHSDNFGLLQHHGQMPWLTSKTVKHASFMGLLSQWAREKVRARYGIDFPFTSICINKNYQARAHKDRGNMGPSAIMGVGDYKGGALLTWNAGDEEIQKHSIRNSVLLFDGNCLHAVEPYDGKERYSLVFFTLRGFERASRKEQGQLADILGAPLPSASSLQRAYDKCVSTCKSLS